MAITFITPVEISPDVADAWTDADVSAHIPSGSVGVMLHIANASANTRACGFRKNGSTDNRINNLNTNNHMWCMIGVDGSRILELYQGGTATDIDIYLVGYLGAADAFFFTDGVDKSTATTGSYVDVDISGDLQGADDASAAILEVIDGGGGTMTFAVRPKGSTDDRVREITSVHSGFLVGVDANNVFEQKIGHGGVDLFLVGYLKVAANFVAVDPATAYDPASADAWTDLTALSAGDVGALVEYVTTTATPQVYGLRTNGSAEDIKPRGRHNIALVACDGSQIIEGYQDITGNQDFFLTGRFTASVVGGFKASRLIGGSVLTDGLV